VDFATKARRHKGFDGGVLGFCHEGTKTQRFLMAVVLGFSPRRHEGFDGGVLGFCHEGTKNFDDSVDFATKARRHKCFDGGFGI
jgi:hypothetical protein